VKSCALKGTAASTLSGTLIDPSQLSTYDLLAAALQLLLVIGALVTAGVYVSKRSGNRSANVFFALLLAAFALSVATLVLEHLGLPAKHPRLRFLPLWFTWTIGPAWFYYVKFSLFPAYQFRWTDLKHFVFPILQPLVYAAAYFRLGGQTEAEAWRAAPWVQIEAYGLTLGSVEEIIFLLSVGGYLFAGYRYLRYRARQIGRKRLRWDYWKVLLLRRAQRVLFVLLIFNFVFVLYNFAQTQLIGVGVLHVRSFYASSSLSFGLILLYLLRGVAYRQHFYPQVPLELLEAEVPELEARFKELIEGQSGFRDPDLHRVRTARAIGATPDQLDDMARAAGAQSWWKYITRLRLGEVARLRRAGLDLRTAALESGFASRRQALRAFRSRRRQ